MANLISLKVSDDVRHGLPVRHRGRLRWIYDNKDLYNIRVVNLSIHSTVEQSYHDSPLTQRLRSCGSTGSWLWLPRAIRQQTPIRTHHGSASK